jgi:hypothetical protein
VFTDFEDLVFSISLEKYLSYLVPVSQFEQQIPNPLKTSADVFGF